MHKCTPYHYQQFVRFAYYTGARQGEIRNLVENNIYHEHLEIDGKTGKRIIKLNTQAQEVLQKQHVLWSYCRRYVNHTFKKNVRKMYIKNARFHDLRRTFGYNLVKQGRPIYEVSKLLGHSSVTTTEKHYAPLISTDVNDFIL